MNAHLRICLERVREREREKEAYRERERERERETCGCERNPNWGSNWQSRYVP